ncbi:MAG: hypothetical protein R6U61_06575 [Thermoplasmata archaeon]
MKSTVDERSLRRVSHISTFMLVFYYWLPEEMLGFSNLYALLSLTVLVVVADLIRIAFNVDVPGQRWYEKGRLSALAWVFIGASMVITLFPAYLVIPSILCMAFVDPILSIRREKERDFTFLSISFTTAFFIFIISLLMFSPWNLFFAFIFSLMAGLMVLVSERQRSYHVDDDFLLVVVPPSVVYLVILSLGIPP